MKVISIAAAGVSLVLVALTLAPSAGEYRPYFAIGALLSSALALITIVVGWRERLAPEVVTQPVQQPTEVSVPADAGRHVAIQPTSEEPVTPSPVKAALVPSTVFSSDADVVSFLAALQDKGRLVDFLQDDITAYSDAQVGAAARVVHQGCKTVLNEYFRIVPVRVESEGAKVTVPSGYAADEYRLAGKISGQAPFSGTLMHRGWKAESVTLPRTLRSGNDRMPTIAPAEIELR